jgi:DNA transposition AAA+ family ATPase
MEVLELIQHADFTTDSVDDVKVKLRSLLAGGELKLRDIEDKIDYAGPTISQHLAGKYQAENTEQLDSALIRFYQLWIAEHTIVETKLVRSVNGFLDLAWKRRRMVRIRGDNGVGKTKATNAYVAQNDYAIKVKLSGVTAPNSLLNAIGRALGIDQTMVGSRQDRLDAIIRALKRKPRLLIIDEADELVPKTLKILRDVHGDENAYCGMVLVGTDALDKLLRDPDLRYMRRRIKMTLDVGYHRDDRRNGESKDIYRELRKIADMWPHKLSDHDLKEVFDWALDRFTVDSLVTRMTVAYDVALTQGKKKIDQECLKAALGYVEQGV